MPNIGPMELIIVLALALIILGPKKLPEAGRSLGRGMREFKDSLSLSDGGSERRPATETQPDMVARDRPAHGPASAASDGRRAWRS